MICTTIKRCSSEVQKWILNQSEVGEESITDWMLFKLHDIEQNISYKLFDKTKEARITGADFEFWILTNNYNFRARVQAKRLRRNKDHHSSIAYSNKHGYQIEKLINDARNNGFRPLYALYNEEKLASQCRMNITDEGVYLACAYNLYNDIIKQPRQFIDSQFLISRSTPFSCWFCCPLCNNNPPNGTSLIHFLEHYHPLDNAELPNGITEDMPDYISSFIELNKAEFEIRNQKLENWEKEFLENIKNIKSLLVINARK